MANSVHCGDCEAPDYIVNEQENIVLRNWVLGSALQSFYKLNSFLIYRVIKLTSFLHKFLNRNIRDDQQELQQQQ